MSDGPVMAEFADRIQRLNDLADAERELQRARSAFESAQWEVVRAAEQFQEWTYEWRNRRARVLSALPDDTPVDVKLEEANATILRFCEKVEQDRLAISALSPKSSEGRLDQEQQLPDQSSPQASETDAAEEDPTAVAIAAYIEAENADTPTDAERTSVVTDHDRVDQTNTDTVAAVEIPEGFIPWSGEDVFTPTPDSDDKTYSVEVLYRDGTRNINKAWTFVWGWKDNAESSSNIIAYKVISEPAEASEPAEIISTLTGDPAIEPESGLHGEPLPPSELDSQAQAQPQTKSEQSEIFHPDASTWNAGFEEDRKPKPGFIEGAVSKLFGVKEPA